MNVISSIFAAVAAVAITSAAALAVPPAQPNGKTPSIKSKAKPAGSSMHPHAHVMKKKKAAM